MPAVIKRPGYTRGLIGFLLGAGSGTLLIYRLVSRFLETFD